jgi:hypothetical protein
LITSAPRSPRIIVAYGPARTVEQSTTRMPARGPPPVGRSEASDLAIGVDGRPRHGRRAWLDDAAPIPLVILEPAADGRPVATARSRPPEVNAMMPP